MVLVACIFWIMTILTKISNLQVPPSRGELGSGQTELQTTSALAGTPSGMHTTSVGTLSSSIFQHIQKILRFVRILRNRNIFWIFRGGGHSMVPLPLVFVSRDTWTTPETTLTRWRVCCSAAMISTSSSFKKSHGIIIIWKMQPNHQV